MNYIEQIILLLFSFAYGIITFFLLKINAKIFNKEKKIIRSVSFALVSFNIALIYIMVLYLVNNGIIHIYFILLYILGFVVAAYKKCKIKEKVLSKQKKQI